MRRILRSQQGVAMVTVLFIGAAMTVVTSAAAFTTIKEFRQGSDDRKAAQAIALAEAGIDRMLTHIKSGLVTFRDLNKAGCGSSPAISLPTGTVGNGHYTVSLTVYDPDASDDSRFPPDACATRPSKPHPGQDGEDNTWFQITSKGQHPDATRTIRQLVALRPIGLPIGIYARAISVQSANHPFRKVSMVAETTITNRDRLAFIGTDAYYLVEDFWGEGGVTGLADDAPAPTGAHAAGYIQTRNGVNEFTTSTKNCAANNDIGEAQKEHSLWDGDGSAGSGDITSGCTSLEPAPEYPVTTFPESSKFTSDDLSGFAKPELSQEDHQVLKEAAKLYGVYCSFPGPAAKALLAGDTAGSFCYRENVFQGTPLAPNTDYMTMISGTNGGGTGGVQATRNSFIAYFEFRNGTPQENNITRTGTVWGCDDTDPNPPDTNQSIVVVVRNGGVDYSGAGGHMINGAFLIDGDWTSNGQFTFNGSIIAGGNVHFQSSSQNYSLDDCWVENMPGPFFETVPGHWSEIDR